MNKVWINSLYILYYIDGKATLLVYDSFHESIGWIRKVAEVLIPVEKEKYEASCLIELIWKIKVFVVTLMLNLSYKLLR